MYIKLPMYLFLYMALGINDFDAEKSITRALGRGGPSKFIFLHQNPYVLRHINNRYINSYFALDMIVLYPTCILVIS
jgi:hypothetical protein